MQQAINWFEIPVVDLDRAQRFYETVLDRALRREDMGGTTMAVFPHQEPHPGGCLMSAKDNTAVSDRGVRIYLDCEPGIDAALARIEKSGGAIVVPKTALPPGLGFFAHVRDTEGNVVGLHALA